MPLNVSIAINGSPISHFHIGRLAGNTSPDSKNVYAVVESDRPDDSQVTNEEWLAAPKFDHFYGDGAEKCVALALEAYLKFAEDHADG